tara:strand:- start:13 stop:375 length:363 start_codon:yes stop_codon:yes gene_type:complete
MAHFAEIDPKTNIVKRVIVAEQDFINSGAVGDSFQWVQTSYNTRGGVNKTGGYPLRKNYAGKGFTYDKDRDAFIEPKPYPSWTLNEDTCQWEAPVAYPADGSIDKRYNWNEETTSWDEIA